ncbi:4-coumarate--CoA ligase 5 [Biomphalaria pfeifferi]|uniref:Luciferin 4-monooxygenase n=1 Tax=Biomphalaria pfeifferi TaxID=112525 RepID=A0AAD8BB27_BIOPF|nr:4-coumarate--CoA ligase 5 [Biomphalaria pfeifferi]
MVSCKAMQRQLHKMMSCMFLRNYLPITFRSRSPLFVCSKWMSTSTLIGPDNVVRSHLPDINIPTNVPFHQFLFEKCDQYKNLVAVEEFSNGQSYTFGQLKEKAIRVASGLHRLGYRKGDVISVFSTNHINYSVLMLACAATGVWFSAVNPLYKEDELRVQLVHSNSKAVFTTASFVSTVTAAVRHKELQIKDLFVFGEAEGFRPFQTLLDDDGRMFPDVDINPVEDVFILPYSSGTTGLPKGVMLTHYNCMASCLQIDASLHTSPEDRVIGLLPLFHIYGMIVVQFTVLLGGSSVVYLPKFEPETFLSCLQNKKITLAHLVPPLVVFLAKHPLVSQYNLTSLRTIICGAAPLGSEITSEFQKRFDKTTINQGYGMTELSPVASLDTTNTAGSIGHLVVNTLAKIVNQENQTLPPGGVGEICVKGPQVMKGYYNNKQATDEMIEPSGWLHTGDLGYFTKDGILFTQDRLKELIKFKAFQVPPAELEALLLGHADVQDVAVLGVPDLECGELPKAFVVKKPGSKVNEQELVKYVEDRVSPTKRLRGGVQFIEEIPKSASGKILRRVIREKYL